MSIETSNDVQPDTSTAVHGYVTFRLGEREFAAALDGIREVLRLEVRGRQVIHDLMSLFWEGAEHYLRHGKATTARYGGKLYLQISANYRNLFERRLERGKRRLPWTRNSERA